MKVRIESNIVIHGVFEPPLDVVLEKKTVSLVDLLANLQDVCKNVALVSKKKDLGDDINEIFVNGKSHFVLPPADRVLLKDGDAVKIEVSFTPLGGG